MTEKSTACSASEVLEDFNKRSMRVAWPRLADLLDVPPEMQHRIQRLHEYKVDPALLVKEEESLKQVLSYWENNDPNHTWETLSLALMSDRIYKDLGASLYFKHVKPEEFTLDKVYEEVKEITNPREIAYVLIMDSKKLREIWGENADKLTLKERTKLAINHWMTSHPLASWMLLAKHIERYIHGEHEAAAQKIATTIREKYLPKVEEKMEFGPPKDSEKRKFPEKFGANEAFKELTAVEDWFGLGWFLEIEEEELKQIEKEHVRDDDRKLAMLKLWEELNPKSSWDSLTTAVRKMPQHQTLAEDIQEIFLEAERRQKLQKNLKELYHQFFPSIIKSLSDDQVYLSLIDQLTSRSLISEADKEERSIPTDQVPKARACSLLVALNIEKNPLVVIELMKAMEEIEELKLLAEKMKAHGQDYAKKDERQLGLIRHKKTESEERLAEAKTKDYKEELKIVKEELDGKHKVVKVLTRQNEDLQQQVEQKNVHIIELQERVITLEESTISSVSDLDKLTTAVQTSISLPSSQLVGMQVVAEKWFEVQGGSAQPLLWEEHGFRMHIPQDALLPNETCLVFVKAIVAGLFQFPKGTERVSAVYAISSTQQFHKPVMTELQHCVQLDNSEQGKYMSFAVAQHDPSSICYQFQPLTGGFFQANSHYGILERDHFCILTILKYLASYVVDDFESEKSAGNDQAEMRDLEEIADAERISEETMESAATDSKEACPGHGSSVEVPCNVYRLMTFYEKQESWIIAVSQKYNTIEEHVKNCINSGIPEVKMLFCFKEKEEECLEIAVKPEATDDGWIISQPLYPCTIDKKEVDSQDANAKYHPVLRKVRVSIADYKKPPTTTLNRSVPLYGTRKPNQRLGFTFKPPDTRRRDSADSIQSLLEFSTLRPKQDDTPDRAMFFIMVVKKIPDKWLVFGIMVLSDIPTGQLKAIERECNNKQEKCFIEIYNLCISQLPQFTWKTVLRALKDIGENTLCRDLIGHLDI